MKFGGESGVSGWRSGNRTSRNSSAETPHSAFESHLGQPASIAFLCSTADAPDDTGVWLAIRGPFRFR